MENKLFKYYGHVVCVQDNRWLKCIMAWLPGGSRRRGRLEVKWEKRKGWWIREI